MPRINGSEDYGPRQYLIALRSMQYEAPFVQAITGRHAKPKPFDLMAFLAAQGEALQCELADGVRAGDLYRRYVDNGSLPETCVPERFARALRAYRKQERLPPWDKPRPIPVADAPTQLVTVVPATLPSPAPGAPAPVPKFVRPSWRWDGSCWWRAE